MTIIKMDIGTLVEHQRALGNRLMPAIRRGFMSGGKRCIPILLQATDNAPPANPAGMGGGAVNTGSYKRAWKSRPDTSGGVRVFNDSSYAAVIEYGRRPGGPMPPIEAIARWAQRKIVVSQSIKTRRVKHLSEGDARRIAFVIARAIAKRGLKARNVMTDSLPSLHQAVMAEVMFEIDRALAGDG